MSSHAFFKQFFPKLHFHICDQISHNSMIIVIGCKENKKFLETASADGDFAEFKKLGKKCIKLYNAGLGKGPEPCLHCQGGMLPQT